MTWTTHSLPLRAFRDAGVQPALNLDRGSPSAPWLVATGAVDPAVPPSWHSVGAGDLVNVPLWPYATPNDVAHFGAYMFQLGAHALLTLPVAPGRVVAAHLAYGAEPEFFADAAGAPRVRVFVGLAFRLDTRG